MSAVTRARIARRRAQRLGLAMTQRAAVYRLADDRAVTVELGSFW
jgi:hypothetical protein